MVSAFLERCVDRRIIGRQVRQIDRLSIGPRMISIDDIMPAQQMPPSDHAQQISLSTARTTVRPGHGCRFQRHEILLQTSCRRPMPGHWVGVLRPAVELEKLAHARLADIEAGVVELALVVSWGPSIPGARRL